MNDVVTVSLIAGGSSVISALGVAAITSHKIVPKVEATRDLVQKVELSINSRMTALLQKTEEAATLAATAAENRSLAVNDGRDTAVSTLSNVPISSTKPRAFASVAR